MEKKWKERTLELKAELIVRGWEVGWQDIQEIERNKVRQSTGTGCRQEYPKGQDDDFHMESLRTSRLTAKPLRVSESLKLHYCDLPPSLTPLSPPMCARSALTLFRECTSATCLVSSSGTCMLTRLPEQVQAPRDYGRVYETEILYYGIFKIVYIGIGYLHHHFFLSLRQDVQDHFCHCCWPLRGDWCCCNGRLFLFTRRTHSLLSSDSSLKDTLNNFTSSPNSIISFIVENHRTPSGSIGIISVWLPGTYC